MLALMGQCFSELCSGGSYRNRRRPNTAFSNGRYTAETPNPGDLVVSSVNYLISGNSRRHRTDKYFLSMRPIHPQLIIRRGQPFDLRITFERKFRYGEDVLSLVFLVKDEPNPSYSNRTEITVPVLDERNARRYSFLTESRWSARIVLTDGNSVTIEVNSSPEAIIGEYNLVIDTKSPTRIDDSFYSNPISQSFIMLFNPWSRGDAVFMSEWQSKEEYVLNDQGLIWRGTHNQMKTTHWNFAQFEENIIEACLYALSSVGKLAPADRNDPIKVSRHIAAIVNSKDDRGIVVGNWGEDFSGGTEPTGWHGSAAILQQFYRTKRSVKFGQCWVFSGVTCTIARCLGIPCRVITNYLSAHDTHNSITVDRFFDEDGEPVKKLNKDSIWNFHSWDEVWMSRPDLSASGAYDGWNVIDATPQEASTDGTYRVGPTSVEAIKYGEVTRPYDGFFVYAEVNADEVYWLYREDKKPMKLITHSTDTIGVNISTKAELKDKRMDITSNYKHKENSKHERESMIKALKMTRNYFSRYYLNEKFEDVRFELLPMEDRLIGQSFEVQVLTTNHSNKVYTVEMTVHVRATPYNAEAQSWLVKQEHLVKTIGPRKRSDASVVVTFDEYKNRLSSQAIFNVSVMTNVLETDYQFYMFSDYRLRLPDIKIETEGEIIVGRPFTCHVSFLNPLARPLTKGVFSIEGPDYSTRVTLPLKGIVPANEVASTFAILTPKSAGKKRITAKFKSLELNDVDGMAAISVAEDTDGNNNIERNVIIDDNNNEDELPENDINYTTRTHRTRH